MKILALNCAGHTASLAFLDKGILKGTLMLRDALTRGDALMERLEMLLRDLDWTMTSIDAIGVTRGPGSFTGIRVGLATAQGLSLAMDRPVFGISTLKLMSLSFPFAKWPVCPLLDARRSEVYGALYECSSGSPKLLLEEAAYDPGVLLEKLPDPLIVCGEGAALLRAYAKQSPKPPHFFEVEGLPDAGEASALAAWVSQRLQAGDDPKNYPPTPIYLRKSEAERRLEERQRINKGEKNS